MEQLELFAVPLTEEQIFEELRDTLIKVVAGNNLCEDKLKYKKMKNYSSVWYGEQMAFRIRCQKNHNYFSVSNQYTKNSRPEIAQTKTDDGQCDGFTNYAFEPTIDGITLFSEFLADVLDQAIDTIPKEFDCCSRYMACSDAKRCIHPNPDMAAACGYRHKLKQGFVFFGENRNV